MKYPRIGKQERERMMDGPNWARRIAEEQYPDNPVFNVVAVRPARKWGE